MSDDRRPAPHRYAEDVDLDSQFPDTDLRAPEPEYDAPAGYPDEDDRPAAPAPRRRGPDMSRAPRPQDRQAPAQAPEVEDYPEAVMDEATGVYVVSLQHDGMTFTIPADPADWPIKATRAFEQGKIITAVEELLPAREFNALLSANYRNNDFGKLYERLAKAGGFDTSGN